LNAKIEVEGFDGEVFLRLRQGSERQPAAESEDYSEEPGPEPSVAKVPNEEERGPGALPKF